MSPDVWRYLVKAYDEGEEISEFYMIGPDSKITTVEVEYVRDCLFDSLLFLEKALDIMRKEEDEITPERRKSIRYCLKEFKHQRWLLKGLMPRTFKKRSWWQRRRKL